jgi:hypothetical protein
MIRKLRSIAVVGVFMSTGAATAQDSPVKCPKPGATFQYSDGSSATWTGPEGNYCKYKYTGRAPNNHVSTTAWFAPTMTASLEQAQSYAKQLKPEQLWPLEVGKKVVGRYDGAGAQGQGSWQNTITVKGYEKVTTKAGTLDAFVVTKVEEGLSNKYRSTKVWYAPELAVTVKFTFSTSSGTNLSGELVSIKQ